MLTLIAKEELNDDDLLKSQQVIYNLISFEARNEPLTLPISQHKYGYSLIFFFFFVEKTNRIYFQ